MGGSVEGGAPIEGQGAHVAGEHWPRTKMAKLDVVIEVILGATIIWCLARASMIVGRDQHDALELSDRRRSIGLNSSAATWALTSGVLSILLTWGAGKRGEGWRRRWRALFCGTRHDAEAVARVTMPLIILVGIFGGVLTVIAADLQLLFEICCQGVLPMQRLANSLCAIAASTALAAMRASTLVRWYDLTRVPFMGPGREQAATLYEDAFTTLDTVKVADGKATLDESPTILLAPALSPDMAPTPFERTAALAALMLICEWALTMGAIKTNQTGFVICSDFLQSCGIFHDFWIDWPIFVLWPFVQAVCASVLLAQTAGLLLCCCSAKGEQRMADWIANSSLVIAIAQIIVVIANSLLDTSGALGKGARLQFGPGLGAFGLQAALALLRVRRAADLQARLDADLSLTLLSIAANDPEFEDASERSLEMR
ncbi:hypothetical protein T492DRAFT_1030734 [Pavlovales sp. CCMP2436]|nr:hypothetical protein T492DRAFT_1030734 [Pavlovales sp. CCMP2436]|mmetsp:Transcript_12314/g.31077  ORF Transcript_12314/g.31077 Transcript_12314/m.31077 type:complete len:429 (-) Transcript_12314:113-1399(-)